MNTKIIAVDFDGTLCESKWPAIGAPNMMLIQYLQNLGGVKLILWTCRNGSRLTEAVLWCAEHGLKFDAVNENLPEVINELGVDTRKVFANEYIDDRNSSFGVFNPAEFVKAFDVFEKGIVIETMHCGVCGLNYKRKEDHNKPLGLCDKCIDAFRSTQQETAPRSNLTNSDLSTIERFISKTDKTMDLSEMQVVVKMQYAIYKHLMEGGSHA